MRLFFTFLFGIVFSINVFAQDIEYYTPEDIEIGNSTISQQQYFTENESSIFKFAWEKPHYGYDYSYARRGGWLDPSSAGNIIVAGFITRHEQDGDSRAFSGYASFRPFLFDFGTYSFAVGVSYFGTIQKYYEPTNIANNEDVGGVLADITTQDIDIHLNYQGFNFSILGSFPEIAVQVVFEVGYLLTNLRADIQDIRVLDSATQGALFDLNESNYRYNQRDHGLFISLEVSKIFERNYFSLVSLYMYAHAVLNSERRRSRADVDVTILGIPDNIGRVEDLTNVQSVVFGEIGNIDPEDDTLNTSYIGAFLNTRLINIPFGIPEIGELTGIALGMINGIEYGYGEILGSDVHGAALQAGVQLTVLELLSVSFINTWHQSNDFDDEWSLTVAVGLYGAVTPSSGRGTSPGISIF